VTEQIEWRTGKKVKPVYEYTGEESWRQDALCAQIDVRDIFFPEHSGEHGREAKKICAACEVRDACLEWALHRPEWGIWGGKSANERKAMRRDLGIKLVQEPRIEHGTESGARAHYRLKVPICKACRDAELTARRDRIEKAQ
jgi:WhiB family redox-sensing transcriptional regulator